MVFDAERKVFFFHFSEKVQWTILFTSWLFPLSGRVHGGVLNGILKIDDNVVSMSVRLIMCVCICQITRVQYDQKID
jgi:hypothetical protein